MEPFETRLTRQPIPFETEVAGEVLQEFAVLSPALRDLLAGTAGCSPFLRDLMRREGVWLREALAGPPEAALADVLEPLGGLASDALPVALRQAKRRVALLTALADLGGVWPLEAVTGALTALADRAVDRTIRALVDDEARRGKLPGVQPGDPGAGGMVVLAMGKMGAGELNYSSDIDLICLFDETRYVGVEAEARAAFVRVARKMTAILGDRTGDGYVFRTDLRLRPDASVTPVCLSMAAAEQYYESEGRTWERAAYIKARPCGGDVEAGERFLKTLTPFVWRRHLDFNAIEDAHAMRLRIRDHKGLHGPVTLEGHNMKLGAGGIREIEFFTQTRQLIAGGRDPSLRDRTTVGALAALAEAGWLPKPVAAELTTHYRAHRELEHRLQMIHDAQTHAMPVTEEGIDRVARLSGEADTGVFRKALAARLARVGELTEGFFDPGAAEKLPELTETQAGIVAGWPHYPALRTERAQSLFRRVAPQIHAALSRAANPDEALAAFDGFLRGLPAGVQVFALFASNPTLVDLIADIAATSPALARYLARNAGVLDAVIGGSFWEPWPGIPALSQGLSAALAPVADYERKLHAARVWLKEWHFRVGVHHLRGLIDSEEAGKLYADLAEVVIAILWPVVVAEMAVKHGPPPGRGAIVLGMGSLGAGRLNAQSDLDLIVIYDAAGQEESEGPKPLPARTYYSRLTQALITALTAQMPEGRLYEVDMRLRPSGRQGPVATSLRSFESYQKDEAWTWEHLALTRARPLAGDAQLAVEVEGVRRAVIQSHGRGEATIRADVAAMRARLASAKPGGGWDVKLGPGRLLDIELAAQAIALLAGDPARRTLAQIAAGPRKGLLGAEEELALRAAFRLCWNVQAAGRLMVDGALDPANLGAGGLALLLRETGAPDAASLSARLEEAATSAAGVIERLFPGEGANGEG